MAGTSLPARLAAAARRSVHSVTAPPEPVPPVLSRVAPADDPLTAFAATAAPRRDPEASDAVARVRFDDRLTRALAGAERTEVVLDVAARALDGIDTPAPTELLLVTPGTGRITQVAETGPDDEGPGCPVVSAAGCEALHSGRTQVYDSSEELDACPQLRDRLSGPCSAACVPLVVLGRSIGVLHRTAPDGSPPSSLAVAQMATLADRVGNRLALLRAVDAPPPATYDATTGALDRASVEARALQLARSLVPFCLAQCDLDGFRGYAATFGADTAEHALRTAATATREMLRPDDLVGRFGDDELLLVLPETSYGEAERVLERVREHLVLCLTAAGLPPITASFGLAESALGRTLDELLVAADAAVTLAKDLGRNRVMSARDGMFG